MKEFLKSLLTHDHWNSRFIYLLSSVVTAFCLLALVTGFIFDKSRAYYTDMVLALLGGGIVGGGLSKYLSKRPGSGDEILGDSQKSTKVTKEVTEEVTKGKKVK